MAYIKVNHKKLGQTASKIDGYVNKHKARMRKIDLEMNLLRATWDGADYREVKRQWAEMQEGESTSGQMVKALENYAEFLRYAEGKYRDAQAKAINRANRLRW